MFSGPGLSMCLLLPAVIPSAVPGTAESTRGIVQYKIDVRVLKDI